MQIDFTQEEWRVIHYGMTRWYEGWKWTQTQPGHEYDRELAECIETTGAILNRIEVEALLNNL